MGNFQEQVKMVLRSRGLGWGVALNTQLLRSFINKQYIQRNYRIHYLFTYKGKTYSNIWKE